MGKTVTLTPIEAAEGRIAALDAERQRVTDALTMFEQQRAAHAANLASIQAHAVRTGDTHAADLAEAQDADLARQIARQQAALAAIEADRVTAQQALTAAQRDQWEQEITAVRAQAVQIADQLAADLCNTALWGELQTLHDQAARLSYTLTGFNPLDVMTYAKTPHPALWTPPGKALDTYLNALRWWATKGRPPFASEDEIKGYRQLYGRDWKPPVKTLRAALGLD